MGFIRNGLIFKEVEPKDLAMLRDIRNHFIMQPGWHDPTSVQTMLMQEQWYKTLDREHQAFMVYQERVVPVGLLRFKLDYLHRQAAMTGTDVFPEYQKQGLGRKILRSGTEYVIGHLGMHRATAQAIMTNRAAQKIISACGYTLEGNWRQYMWVDGKYEDFLHYGILESEL